MSVYKHGRTIAEFVVKYRERNELTQLELANMLRVHPQYVSNVERGVHKHPRVFCMRLLKSGVEPDAAGVLMDLLSEEMMEEFAEKSKTFKVRRHKS